MADVADESDKALSKFITRKEAEEVFASLVISSNEEAFYYRNRNRLLIGVWSTIVVLGAIAGGLITWLGYNTIQDVRNEAIEAARSEAEGWIANRSDIIDGEIRAQLSQILPEIAESIAQENVEEQLSRQSQATFDETVMRLSDWQQGVIDSARAQVITLFPALDGLEQLEEEGVDIATRFNGFAQSIESLSVQTDRTEIAIESAFRAIEDLRENQISELESNIDSNTSRLTTVETRNEELFTQLMDVLTGLEELERLRRISELSCHLFVFVIPTDALARALNPVPPNEYPELDFELRQSITQINDECYQ